MEINGISFEDWAAAAANIAYGTPFEKILEILGIEEAVWEDTNKKWGEKLGDLMASDMQVATKYAEIFSNPKVGKFAEADTGTASIEETLKIAPDYDTYMKIFMHQSKAAEVGLDPGEILAEYGLNIGQWGQLNSHWSEWVRVNINENEDPEAMAQLGAHNKWEEYFDKYYADYEEDLADDIDFDDEASDDEVDPDWVPNDKNDDNDYNNSDIKVLMREANSLQNDPEKAVVIFKKAIALMEKGNNEDYDYDNLYAHYFIMKYYQQQTGEEETKQAVKYAESCLELLSDDIRAGNIWHYTEFGQFQEEVIRVASNTVAWNIMLNTSDTEKLDEALDVIDLGIDYINEDMPSEYYLYLYDTKVRILMKMNDVHTAYCWVYQVLEEEPNFPDFDDIKNSAEYNQWLKSDEFKSFLEELEKKMTMIGNNIFKEFRSVIEWKNPNEKEIFIKFKNENGEIKNTSKLILQVGQGAILTYEGKIEEVLLEEGIYDLKTSNIPFITKLKKFLELRNRSEHILGIWFFRKADIVNMRWGTAVPIAYNDPFYTFPILLSAFGNYSIKITKPVEFFTNIVAGKNLITSFEVKEIFLSRITQPITDYLANAKFSYIDIDSNLNNIATNIKEKSREIFEGLGFELLDFRIEGTQFDKETLDRINEVSEVQADVKSSSIAGIDYVEMRKLKALKDAAKNQGSIGVLTGVNLIQNTNTETKENIKSKLLKLKELLDLDLISKEEFDEKKKKLLEEF